MSTREGVLDTGVTSSHAILTGPPNHWSYSSLKQVRECPLRYALVRADYPDLWGGRGYPPLPTVPSLFGNVVHASLEVAVKALATAGIDSPQTIEATEVLRRLGGLTEVVEVATSTQLARLDANPRLDLDRRRRIARDLRNLAPEARAQVQSLLSRASFVPGAYSKSERQSEARSFIRKPLAEGSHVEVALVAEEPRLIGRIDLLTIGGDSVDIVDYKTGAESPEHTDQMRLYAVLWDSDRFANPERLAVSGLTLAYPGREVPIELPSTDEIRALADALTAEVEEADMELRSDAPRSLPSRENCKWCPVRQLCAAYWQVVAPDISDVAVGELFDYEGIVSEQHGQRSWRLRSPQAANIELLLRAATNPHLATGDRVRILSVRRDPDTELAVPRVSLVAASELFKADPST